MSGAGSRRLGQIHRKDSAKFRMTGNTDVSGPRSTSDSEGGESSVSPTNQPREGTVVRHRGASILLADLAYALI
jgi:hypothetical protein